MKAALSLLVALTSFLSSLAQVQVIYYEPGHKAIEGRWQYASTLYLFPNMIEYAYDVELNSSQPADLNSYIQKGLSALNNTQLIFDGPITLWYRNGQKKLEITYSGGVASGPCRRYYQSGVVAEEGNLINGFNSGQWRYYTPDGKIYLTGTYRPRTQEEMGRLLQERIYYAKLHKGSIRTAEQDAEDPDQKTYYFQDNSASDTLQATARFRALFVDLHKITGTEAARNGVFTFYYPSGHKKAELNYSNNIRIDNWTYYRENGKPLTVIHYDQGKIVSVTDSLQKTNSITELINNWNQAREVEKDQKPRIAESPKSDQVFTFVEQMPSFNGDLNAYIASNLRYPLSARKEKKEGRVSLRFVVRDDGRITDVEVRKGLDPEMDTEAIRIIKGMPAWKPGKQNGRAVNCYFSLPVVFQLK